MSDEVASAALSSSQKAIEVALELIRMLAPMAKKLLEEVYQKTVGGVNAVGGKIANARTAGTVTNKGLIVEAQKANSPIATTSNFLARDAELVAAKAKEYKIPVAIIGNGEKQTLEYLERDKGVIEQITTEIMQERLKNAPQSVKCFVIGENNVSSMKALFEENGIECQFVGGRQKLPPEDGKISCIYPAECAEQVAVIKNDYKEIHANVEANFGITPNVPETERQLEIKAQIAELQNARENPELRGKFYEETAADTEIEFPVYSEKNMERVHSQMPSATKVAGKAFWEEQGYALNDGAKGVDIIAPQMDDNGDPVLDENGKQTFTSITVYDISETNAYEKSLDKKIGDLQREYDEEKINAFDMSDDKKVVLSDELSGAKVEITVDSKLRKSDVSEILQKELGYSEVQADIAANKLCYDLELDKNSYFRKPTQIDNIDALKTNIRYPSEDLTLRDVRFDAVNFKDGQDTHLILRNGDNAVGLTPAKMTREEMNDICVNELGLSEYQAGKAVDKAVKIESQVRSQVEERAVNKQGVSQEAHIERSSDNGFSVTVGDKTRFYNFSTINLDEKIAGNFDIPRENARNIVNKAKNQSVLQNKIHNASKKKKSAKTAETPKIEKGKGLKH